MSTESKFHDEPAPLRILVTIEISDPETVEVYFDVSDDLLFEDLCNGSLLHKASLVSRSNAGDEAPERKQEG